jgi:glycerol-3-phosphate O-acyltransferase
VHKGGLETVYSIGADQHLAAAFYRNTIIHFFINGAIAELALLRAADQPFEAREAAFWDEALRLRDLLKFEFFFREKSDFRSELDEELKLQSPHWRETLARGREATVAMLKAFWPLSAHSVLRSFFEAYRVVADTLAAHATSTIDERKFITECGAVGRQYMLQQKIQSAESVSKHLFQTGLQLARNQKLLDAGDDVIERRRAFAAALADVMRRIETVEALAHERG